MVAGEVGEKDHSQKMERNTRPQRKLHRHQRRVAPSTEATAGMNRDLLCRVAENKNHHVHQGNRNKDVLSSGNTCRFILR